MSNDMLSFDLKSKEKGAFLIVDHLEGGVQIVRHCLWLHPKVVDLATKTPDIEKLSGRELFKALLGLGAYPRNALQDEQGNLSPLPAKKSERAGIDIERIVPCIQKFDLATKFRFLVKYSDHLISAEDNLDDPLDGVAAYKETDIREPHHVMYIAHYSNGGRHSPEPEEQGASRKAEEQCYYRETGGIYWIKNSHSYGGSQPLFEKFDEAGHPQYLINQSEDAKGRKVVITEFFNETTGECINALKKNADGHMEFLSDEERHKFDRPESPELG